MVDTNEKVILSWDNVNVHVKPPERMCCRGPDPSVPWKHVLRDGKNNHVSFKHYIFGSNLIYFHSISLSFMHYVMFMNSYSIVK